MQKLHNQLQPVRMLIMDVDGVLTDGRIYITSKGEELKSFNTLDGHGLKMLQKTGVLLAIITGRDAKCVALRAKGLGIDYYFAGSINKLETFEHLVKQTGLQASECAYIGDDVVDLPVMRRVAFAATVPEAPSFVKKYSHYITSSSCGRGAVREVCELIMSAQGNFDSAMEPYLL